MPDGFSLDRHLRNAWSMIPEPGPDEHVEIRFAKKVARNVADVLWHKTQLCHFQRDGSLLYRACVSGLHEISWWVLGYGDQAEVLQPPALRELVGKHARSMAKKYDAPTKANGRQRARSVAAGSGGRRSRNGSPRAGAKKSTKA